MTEEQIRKIKSIAFEVREEIDNPNAVYYIYAEDNGKASYLFENKERSFLFSWPIDALREFTVEKEGTNE